MTEKLNLAQKLSKIQIKLKAPKGQYNKFGKYNYRSCEDILEAVKPLNADAGITLTLSDKPILAGTWNYIEATATLMDDETGELLAVTAYAREAATKKGMDESQITGTASSYARKYALNGLYLIDDTKDSDTNEHNDQTNAVEKKQQTSYQNNSQRNNQNSSPNQNNQRNLSEVEQEIMRTLNEIEDVGLNRSTVQKDYLQDEKERDFKNHPKMLNYLQRRLANLQMMEQQELMKQGTTTADVVGWGSRQ